MDINMKLNEFGLGKITNFKYNLGFVWCYNILVKIFNEIKRNA
jgi:hypothetical protein